MQNKVLSKTKKICWGPEASADISYKTCTHAHGLGMLLMLLSERDASVQF